MSRHNLEHHSVDSRGVIYDRNNFIMQATRGLYYKNIVIVNDVLKCHHNLEHQSKSVIDESN